MGDPKELLHAYERAQAEAARKRNFLRVQQRIDVWSRKWRVIKERDRKRWEKIHGKTR